MTTAYKNYPELVENIYVGLPYTLELQYNDSTGFPIDLTGKAGKISVREKRSLDSPEITVASTVNGKMILGNGVITCNLLTAPESLTIPLGTYVGDLVIESIPNQWNPLISILFRVQPITTSI